MKVKYIIYILLGLLFWIGCDDDENLTPSDRGEYEIILPQGNHAYDSSIVNWFDRTGVYILYKFKPSEIYFNVNNDWAESYRDTTITNTWYTLGEGDYAQGNVVHVDGKDYELGIFYNSDGTWNEYAMIDGMLLEKKAKFSNRGSFSVLEADEVYVDKQLNMVENIFLNFYPDSILRSYMPLKIILGRELKKNTGSKESFRNIFNNLIFSYGDETIHLLTEKEIKEWKVKVNLWFINNQINSDLAFRKFYEAADYSWVKGTGSVRPANDTCYAMGFITRPTTAANLEVIKEEDLNAYKELIMGNPFTVLTAEPKNGNYSTTDYTGILHPKKDVKGKIREKYLTVIDEFKRLGIDLQAIGDKSVKK